MKQHQRTKMAKQQKDMKEMQMKAMQEAIEVNGKMKVSNQNSNK